jgi:hypothetical protein
MVDDDANLEPAVPLFLIAVAAAALAAAPTPAALES